MMDPNHSLKVFFRLLQAQSEAQPYYPLQPNSPEVGSVFTDERKIQIVWNACYELFKTELTNMNTTRREDFKGDFNAYKEQFLLAEMHRNGKRAVEDSKKPTGQPKDSANPKVAWKRAPAVTINPAATTLSQAISYASSATRMVTVPRIVSATPTAATTKVVLARARDQRATRSARAAT